MLIVLTLTAAVMSYPWANDLLYTLTGSEPPSRAPASAPAAQDQRRANEKPRASKPLASFEALLARAEQQVPGWVMIMLRFPRRGDGSVTASIQGPDAFHPFQRSQLTLNRATAEVIKWEPYANNSTGRKLRTWMRALHTGEAFGLPGQTVAGLASLGGCFLVWTGLAMAWRRFRSGCRTPKEFTAEEPVMNVNTDQINFLNPRPTESVDAALAQPLSEAQIPQSNGANGHARAVQDRAREHAAAASNAESVLILYGTVTGNSETLAKNLADALRPTGLTARVRDMAHCQPNVLTQANYLLVVASTYGDGEPPDDAAPFWHAVVHGNGLDLRGVRFSVLGLGNTTYDHFCKCGRDFDAALERHGATRFYPRVDCDADYNRSAAAWINGVLVTLQQESLIAVSA